MAIIGLFSFIFVFLKQTLQILQQIYVKNVHGIRAHNLQISSLIP